MRSVLLGNAIADCETHWQEGSEVADRKAMRGILLGNATADCETHWQESSEVALRDSRDFNRKVKRKLRFQ